MNIQVRLPGTEHWADTCDVKLFIGNKCARAAAPVRLAE